jgi:hypothetical protein
MENDSQYEEAMIFQFKADARQGSIATLNQALKRKMGPSSSNHASSQAQKGCPLRTQTIAAGRLRAAALERIPDRRKSPTRDARR